IRDTHFDQDVAQLVDAVAPTWWQKLGRTLQRRPIYSAAALLTIVLLGLWIYPKIALTPERARIEIGQMGLKYDAGTFIERAKDNEAPGALFLRAGINPSVKERSQWVQRSHVGRRGRQPCACKNFGRKGRRRESGTSGCSEARQNRYRQLLVRSKAEPAGN